MEPDFDHRIATLAERQYGIVSLRHVRALDGTIDLVKSRVDSGRWIPMHEGVYRIGGAPLSWRSRLLAACWAGGIRALASGASAAALWSLPSGRTDIIELICPRWKRARHRGLVVHESLVIDDIDRAEIDYIPCTSVARTLFDLGRKLSPVMVDANIDNALRRNLVTVEELRGTADRLATKGRPGGRRFRTAVEARSVISALPESVPERLLADMLVRHGLPAPQHQFVIRDCSGQFVARVDLAYPEFMVVIEYDSVEHHAGTAAHVRDNARRNAITDLEYKVFVATVADLHDQGERLARSIRRSRARG